MRPPLWMAAILVAVASFGLLGEAQGPRPEGPQTAFFRANALYGEGDYAGAAREYQGLLHAGVHAGNVYFNLGNAHFKLGEYGKAILNYLRARRFLPSDPDVQANLAHALAQTGAELCTLPRWQRLLFPLAERTSAAGMFRAVLFLYTALFLTLAGARFFTTRSRWLHWTAIGLAVSLVITSASMVRRLSAYEWRRAAVVSSTGELPVRFEPSETGTTHFVLKEGAQVFVLEERDEWRQVARCDDRRGWVESGAVEEMFPDIGSVATESPVIEGAGGVR